MKGNDFENMEENKGAKRRKQNCQSVSYQIRYLFCILLQ